MFSIKELKKTPEYWLENVQNEIYFELKTYMLENNLNQTELADKLGFSKSYISQILSGEFNYSMKKFIELSLAIGKRPLVKIEESPECENKDNCRVIDFQNYLSQEYFDVKSRKGSIQFNEEKELLINGF